VIILKKIIFTIAFHGLTSGAFVIALDNNCYIRETKESDHLSERGVKEIQNLAY